MNWRSGWRRLASYACQKKNPSAASDVIGTPGKNHMSLVQRLNVQLRAMALIIIVDIWTISEQLGVALEERETVKEKAIFLALLLRHSRGFASMSFHSTPCTASGTRINNR